MGTAVRKGSGSSVGEDTNLVGDVAIVAVGGANSEVDAPSYVMVSTGPNKAIMPSRASISRSHETQQKRGCAFPEAMLRLGLFRRVSPVCFH